jgi:intraflagellar transport protein 46
VVQVLKGKHKPFIPEMIPIVGIPDSFLKIPRPDKEQEMLGLKFLVNLILDRMN